MLLVFIVGIKRTENDIACTAVSSLIQYATLATAFWMGAEAILMFKKLVIVFGRVTTSFIVIISLICWGKLDRIVAIFISPCAHSGVPLIFPAVGLATLATGENYLISAASDESGLGA
jgi:hypothetical protein